MPLFLKQYLLNKKPLKYPPIKAIVLKSSKYAQGKCIGLVILKKIRIIVIV